MKTLLAGLFLCIAFTGRSEILYWSAFSRLNDHQFKVKSYFSGAGADCWSAQLDYEYRSNDTLYLKLIFDTRFISNAFACNRTDTLTQTNFDAAIQYVNVSTGIIRFDSTNWAGGDTLWNLFDSTFNALAGLEALSGSNLQLSYAQNYLTVTGKESIEQLQLIDITGKRVMQQSGNVLDVSTLAPGVYLLRVFSSSGGAAIRWYRE